MFNNSFTKLLDLVLKRKTKFQLAGLVIATVALSLMVAPASSTVAEPTLKVTLYQDAVPLEFISGRQDKKWENHTAKIGGRVHYSYERKEETAIIRPDLNYLKLFQGQGEAGPRDVNSFSWPIPLLSFQVANPSPTLLQFTELEIRASGVRKNSDPIVLFNEPKPYVDGLKFGLFNNGWGRVVDPILRFTVGKEPPAEWPIKSPKFAHEVRLDSFDERAELDIRKFIPNDAVRISEPTGYRGNKPIGTASHTPMFGEISYTTENGIARTVRFRTKVWDKIFGSSRTNPTYLYSVSLNVEPSSYVVRDIRQSIAQQVKPGESADFLFALHSKVSGHFDIVFVLRASDGREIISNPISIDILFPRVYGAISDPKRATSVFVRAHPGANQPK